MELAPFLEAYEWTTKSALSVIECGENPDFICARETAEIIGVELTKVMRRGDIARWERILDRKEEMAPYDMLMKVQSLLEQNPTLTLASDITSESGAARGIAGNA